MTLPFNATDYYAQRTTRPGLKPVTTGSFGGGDTISGYWDGGPSGGATNTNGPYTNPGMGPKPLPGPQGSGGGGSGPDTLQPMGWATGGPRPSSPGTPGQGDGNTLSPIGWSTGPGPTNTHWGSTGTWSSGRPASNGAMSGGPASSTFGAGAGQNLINQQITTNRSPRTQQAAGQTDQARGNVANYQFQGFTPQQPIDTSRTRSLLEQGNGQMQSQQGFQYQPVAGTDLNGARSYLAQAGANIGPSATASGLVGPGAMGGFSYGGDTTGVRGQTKAQLDKVLNTTPDRSTLASNELTRYISESDPAFQQDLRKVGQKAAALGRVGAGMTTSDLGDVAQRRNEQITLRSQELADRTAGLKLQDEQDKLNAARGVTTDFGGMDTAAGSLNLGYQNSANAERGSAFDRARALGSDTFNRSMSMSDADARLAGITRNDALTERDALRTAGLDNNDVLRSRADSTRRLGSDLYGMDQDAYGRSVDERNAGLDYDQRQFNNRRGIFNDMSADEQRLYGNDRMDANDLRGERDYQYGLSRDALGDRRQQRMDQEELLNSRFRRGQGLTSTGYMNDPSDIYGQQAGDYGQQASDSYGAMGDAFGQYALNRSTRPTNARTAPRPRAIDTFAPPEFDIPETRAF